MDKSKELGRKIFNFILKPIETIFKPRTTDSFHTPNHSLEDIQSATDSFSNDTIIIERTEYEKLKGSILNLETHQKESSRVEEEYKRILADYNTAITFFMENKETHSKSSVEEHSIAIEKLILENEKLRKNERRLREHLENLHNDLLNSEERAEAYKTIAMEKIEELRKENVSLKETLDFERTNRSDENIQGSHDEVQHLESIFEGLNVKHVENM